MRKAGYDDVERGERGSSEEHLTVTQFKVQQEQARLAEFTEQNRQQEKQAATLGSKIEKIQNQRVDVRSIEKIVATSIPFSPKVAVEREDFDRLSTLAKKYVTAEKKESKLQKALDAANKLIAKLKAEIDSLKQEISDYKSVRGKLRAEQRQNTSQEKGALIETLEEKERELKELDEKRIQTQANLDAIAKEEKFEYDLKPMDFNGIIPGVTSNQLDGAIAAMTITDERKKSLDFSEGYFESGLSIVANKNNTSIEKKNDNPLHFPMICTLSPLFNFESSFLFSSEK